MISPYTKHLVPTNLNQAYTINSRSDLETWAERIRVENGDPVRFACIPVPNGEYAQYKFLRTEEAEFSSRVDSIDPGGVLTSSVIEGIIGNDRFYALRGLELTGEPMYSTVKTNSDELRDAGFEIPEVLICKELGIKQATLYCSQLMGNLDMQGVIITTNDHHLRYSLRTSETNVAPDIFFKFNREESADVVVEEPAPVQAGLVDVPKYTFDFAGRFPKVDKEHALRLIRQNGHSVRDINFTLVDYLIVSQDLLNVDESAFTVKLKKATSLGITKITIQFLKDFLSSPH